MHRYLSYLLFVVFSAAQAQQDAGVIWMGFEHQWSYNHRLNRLGDYIEQPEFEGYDFPVKHYHTGATGLGWDDAYFTSYYTVLKTRDVGLQSGKVNMQLANKEGQRSSVRQTLTIPLQENLQGRDQLVCILSGFDLVAAEGADKLKMLHIDLGDPVYNYDGSQAEMTVEVGFIADCGSFECHRFHQQYNYSIEVHYLMVAGDRNDFNAAEKSFIKSYEWDRQSDFEDGMIDETVKGFPGFPYATIGFKSLMINMDQDHWLVDWHTAIHPQFYDETTGNFEFSLDLFLKQWKKRKTSFYKLPSRFSKRKEGWAYLGGAVVMLQFRDACLESKSHIGSVTWKGMNREADNNAVKVHRFRVKEDCLW
jgi:hypothetical protein